MLESQVNTADACEEQNILGKYSLTPSQEFSTKNYIELSIVKYVRGWSESALFTQYYISSIFVQSYFRRYHSKRSHIVSYAIAIVTSRGHRQVVEISGKGCEFMSRNLFE